MRETTTILGHSIEIKADLRSNEPIRVQGKVSGQISSTDDLLVESGGVVEAQVATRSIDIHGSVVGEVVASDRFELHADGRMEGNTRAPRVILEDGCKYQGHIETAAAQPRED